MREAGDLYSWLRLIISSSRKEMSQSTSKFNVQFSVVVLNPLV